MLQAKGVPGLLAPAWEVGGLRSDIGVLPAPVPHSWALCPGLLQDEHKCSNLHVAAKQLLLLKQSSQGDENGGITLVGSV